MNTVPAMAVSAGLLAANAFFVAAEFALVASKRHRLEAQAAASRAARVALRAADELSLMLAGAQLGITVCSLGLGALAEPALAHLLDPLFAAAGLPAGASHTLAFVLALAVVVFLHMVVGEMAPKSWAITRPERSAVLLAPAFVAFTRATRPVLALLNALANAVLRLVKVTPQDTLAQVHGPDELRMLLAQSREHGLLPPDQHQLLTRLLGLQATPVRELMVPREKIVTVPLDADAPQVEEVSRLAGRSRLAVVDGRGDIVGLVHVRDAVRATTVGEAAAAAELMTPALILPAETTVAASITVLRECRAQVALVAADGTVRGLVALEDLLEQVLGSFEDETDPASMPGQRPS